MGSVIERKLARKRRGSKVGNLLHHLPSELSNAERRGRLTWLLEAALAKCDWPEPSAAHGPTRARRTRAGKIGDLNKRYAES